MTLLLRLKSTVLGAAVLLAASALMGAAFYQLHGPISREVPCEQAEQKEGFVCLTTVREWPADQVFWIDARRRVDFEKGHLEGALLFNDEATEDFAGMEAEFMGQQAVNPRAHVVIYCDSEACGSSKAVAKHLRENFAGVLGFEVHVLVGGWEALQE